MNLDHFNKQIVILETDEGTARSQHDLAEVWKRRLKEVALHYRIVAVLIAPNEGKKKR